MEAFIKEAAEFDIAVSEGLVDIVKIAELRKLCFCARDLVAKVVAHEMRQTGPLGAFGAKIGRIWLINYPPCLLKYSVNPHLRTAYVIAMVMQRTGTVATLVGWAFYGGWPWQWHWTLDILVWVYLLGHWSTQCIAFAAGRRELSRIFLMQLAFCAMDNWQYIFPNWWDYRWELSFVFPIGFLCYTVWRRPGIKKAVRDVLGHGETLVR